MAQVEEEAEVSEQEPPAQVDPSGRWTRVSTIHPVVQLEAHNAACEFSCSLLLPLTSS